MDVEQYWSAALAHVLQEAFGHILYTLGQQIADCFVMQIKGGPVYPGLLADFFNGDVRQVLLFQQSQKGFVHSGCGAEIFAFRFVQEIASPLPAGEARLFLFMLRLSLLPIP